MNKNRSGINLLALLSTFLIYGCQHSAQTTPSSSTKQKNNTTTAAYYCPNAEAYKGQLIGDGHCVSLIKYCSSAPHTSQWKAGDKVMSLTQGTLKSGTIIATFENGRYTNRHGQHAAIYIKHDENGIWVWDQWVGKAVHKRLIRVRNDNASDSNTAQSYRVIKN